MCGRYKQTSPHAALSRVLGIDIGPGFRPAGVVSPGMAAPVIRDGKLAYMIWGFVPHWSKEDLKTKIINARLETLGEKPSFRGARRCLVPADGFFEWDRSARPSTPYDFHLSSPAPFAFAGLCDTWANPATGELRDTFAIVTTAPSPVVAKVHDRMPLILATADSMASWLNMKNIETGSAPLAAEIAEFAPQNPQLALF